jgi:hypothetical protein
VIVASEPSDDSQDWHVVPDDSVLEATEAGVTVRPVGRAEPAKPSAGPAGLPAEPARPADHADHPNGRVTQR